MTGRHLILVCAALPLAACSTTASRIGDRQAQFDTYPAEVQQKIRAGDVAVGFTPEQVEQALGKPDRVLTHESDAGALEIWAYRKSSPRFGVGLGVFGGGSTRVGGGVDVGTGNDLGEDRIRVVFTAGRVSAVERATE